MKLLILFLFLLLLTACRDNTKSSEPTSSSITPPVLEIQTPDKNTTLEENNNSCIENFQTFFNAELTACVACHKTGGVAINAGAQFLLYENSPYESYASIKEYLVHSSALFLSKPTGLNHQGGSFFETDSSSYQKFEEFSTKIQSEICKENVDAPIVTTSYYEGTTLLSLEETYKKASILLRGRLNTPDEVDLILMMEGKGFEDFLMTNANDQLLVKKYLNENTQATEVLGSYHYPELSRRFEMAIENKRAASLAYFDAIDQNSSDVESKRLLVDEAERLLDTAFNETQRALVNEPLRLIVEVVRKNLPYGEILTANYMMLNPYSAGSYGADLVFDDMDNVEEYKRGEIKSYAFDYDEYDEPIGLETKTYSALPISGLLTSPIFLARYPSTATNKNRARSRAVYKLFLGFDIETLAVRSMDPQELKKAVNPGDSNSSCYGCHIVMDPVAGAFYNWGDNGHFKERSGVDSLPDTYIASALYHSGEVWYSNNIKAGFESEQMPTTQEYGEVSTERDGLIWLAKKIVADERFARASVMFWWRAIYGAELHTKPTVSSDSDFDTRLAIYNQEQLEIEEAASVFTSTNQNLKEMFKHMILSPRFRVRAVDSSAQSELLEDVGVGRLLTPEALNKKIVAVTGYRWSVFYDETQDELLKDYYMFYGGIDSDGVKERPLELNTLMSAVIERMANEISCSIAIKELDVVPQERFFFSDIDPRLEPTSESNILKIKTEIQNLHAKLLDEHLSLDSAQLLNTYKLFYEIWNERRNSIRKESYSVLLAHDEVEYPDNKYSEFCFYESVVRFDESVWEDGVIDWNKSNRNQSDANSPASKLGVFFSPEQTMRAWIAVLTYMFNDYKFVVE